MSKFIPTSQHLPLSSTPIEVQGYPSPKPGMDVLSKLWQWDTALCCLSCDGETADVLSKLWQWDSYVLSCDSETAIATSVATAWNTFGFVTLERWWKSPTFKLQPDIVVLYNGWELETHLCCYRKATVKSLQSHCEVIAKPPWNHCKPLWTDVTGGGDIMWKVCGILTEEDTTLGFQALPSV